MQGHLRANHRPCILVVVREADAASLKRKIALMCGLGWEEQVRFKVVAKQFSLDDLTEYVIDDYFESDFRKVYFQKGLLDQEVLQEEGIDFTVRPSAEALSREIKKSLMDFGIHWERRAEEEWAKSSLGHLTPKEWVTQFGKLGHPGTARSLLKALRVITDAEVRTAFKLSDAEGIGYTVAHAYFHDNEPGSSCITVKNILEHMLPEGAVTALDVADSAYFQDLKADVLYVYEDGLWSGVEIVKRLKALSEIEALAQSKTKIVFRYCVTCDAGLAAARHASSKLDHRLFDIQPAAPGYHFSFVPAGIDLQFPDLVDKSDAAVRAAIDANIEPYVFGVAAVWGEECDDARKMCSDIGEQLVRPYLARKAREKRRAQAMQEGSAEDVPAIDLASVSQEDVDRWKLGAMKFGSTIVFASSIPKPVIPLMWLKGEVTIDGTTVDWKPLFWDARRIAEAAR